MGEDLIRALQYAAEHHRLQRRKGYRKLPYINHLIKVVYHLMAKGEEKDQDLLMAAALHDIVEDTEVNQHDLEKRFGKKVADIVMELSDNMGLPYLRRKNLQVKNAKSLSNEAKKIRIADKTCNIRDIINYPLSWTPKRKLEYIHFAEKVVDEIRGVSPKLEIAFDSIVEEAKEKINNQNQH